MTKFRFDQSRAGSSILVTIEGNISEGANFSNVDLSGVASLNLETAKVEYINSVGISKWVSWIRTVRQGFPKVSLNLVHVPYLLVKQAIGVVGFLPDDAKIKSLVVPYCCDTCLKTEGRVLKSGTDFYRDLPPKNLTEKLQTSGTTCVECGTPMELDASIHTYLMAISKYS